MKADAAIRLGDRKGDRYCERLRVHNAFQEPVIELAAMDETPVHECSQRCGSARW